MKKCILCGNELCDVVLTLHNMPSHVQNLPKKEELKGDAAIDLNLCQCRSCGLVQLDCQPVEYYKDVIRAGGGTKTMAQLRHDQYKHFIQKCHLKNKKIIEIGCGGGEFMQMIENFPVKSFGIEHNVQLVNAAKEKSLHVFNGFAKSGFSIPNAPYDAFCQFNFIEHQPHPNDMVKCIYDNLTEDGYGLVTAPSFEYIANDCIYEIMPDHIAYYTEKTLGFLFQKNGFDILESGIVNNDTLYAIVQKRKLLQTKKFSINYINVRNELNSFVKNTTTNGRKLAFWGASHQCFTAAALIDNPQKVTCIVDNAKFKQGLYSPVSHIPITSPVDFFANPTDSILIIAPEYTDEIACNIKQKIDIQLYALRTSKIEKL